MAKLSTGALTDLFRLFWKALKAVVSGNAFNKRVFFGPGTLSLRDYLTIGCNILQPRRLLDGPYIEQYEQAFASYLGVRHAITFASGRLSLYAILKSMGIGQGDEVLIQAFTCVVVPNAIIHAGAKPVYVDINPHSYNIDINQIQNRISSRTKAIVAQHTFGLPAEMDEIQAIARKYGLRIIEDCALALGTEYKGKKVGTLSEAAIFSSERSKTISTEMGGLAITNDPGLAAKLRHIQRQCCTRTVEEMRTLLAESIFLEIRTQPAGYYWGSLFYPYYAQFIKQRPTAEELEAIKPDDYERRFTNIQARIGLSQMRTLNDNIKHRLWVAEQYEGFLPEIGLPVMPRRKDAKAVFVRYPTRIPCKSELIEYAARMRVEIGNWFEGVIYPPGVSLTTVGYIGGSCPAAEASANQTINLPTHPRIGVKEVRQIKAVLLNFLSERSSVLALTGLAWIAFFHYSMF